MSSEIPERRRISIRASQGHGRDGNDAHLLHRLNASAQKAELLPIFRRQWVELGVNHHDFLVLPSRKGKRNQLETESERTTATVLAHQGSTTFFCVQGER